MGDFVSLVDGLNIASKIRGFSTNVANYQCVCLELLQFTTECSLPDFCRPIGISRCHFRIARELIKLRLSFYT